MGPELNQSGRIKVSIQDVNKPFFLKREGTPAGRLGIIEPDNFGEEISPEAQDLVRIMTLAHLVAPYLPEEIETNFAINSSPTLDGMYRHYGRRPPKIIKSEEQVYPIYKNREKKNQDAEITYGSSISGGADSAWRVTEQLRRKREVAAIHVQNLNKAPHDEMEAAKKQCREWGVEMINVKLLNSSGNGGFGTMRSRDLFIGAVCAAAAHRLGVKEISIEGDMGNNPADTQYSEYQGAWTTFNRELKTAGLARIKGEDLGDIETIGGLIRNERELGIPIISLIQNCFSGPYQRPNIRKKWERETPNIYLASPHQWCGSCIKCRRMTLGRLVYEDPNMSQVGQKEMAFFVKDTREWIQKYPQQLLTLSFLEHLERLEKTVRGSGRFGG